MQRSGVLHIEGMESRLDNILLARQGSTNPVGEGTKFLEVTCRVGDGDTVTVEGITDKIGRDDVIYVRNAWRIEPAPNGETSAEPAATVAPAAIAPQSARPAKKAPAKNVSLATKKAAPKKAAAKPLAAKSSSLASKPQPKKNK